MVEASSLLKKEQVYSKEIDDVDEKQSIVENPIV